MVTVLLLSGIGNGQWYNRRFGVNDINQLSVRQLNEELVRSHKGVTGGIIMISLGAVGIASGAYFIHDAKDPEKPGNIDAALAGMGLLILSIPLEITGLVVLATNSQRVKNINEVLKSTEVKMGIGSSQSFLVPSLSVTIRF